jgi:hypothetical protein
VDRDQENLRRLSITSKKLESGLWKKQAPLGEALMAIGVERGPGRKMPTVLSICRDFGVSMVLSVLVHLRAVEKSACVISRTVVW